MDKESRSAPGREIRAEGLRQLVDKANGRAREFEQQLALVDLKIIETQRRIKEMGTGDQPADLRQFAPLKEELEKLEVRKAELERLWKEAEAEAAELQRHADDMERIAATP